jgi:hypothetical protein
MSAETTAEGQTFAATNGKITGVVGLVAVAITAATFVASAPAHVAVPGLIVCAFAAVLLWGAMLRPGASATRDELTLRTLFETVTIPLAGIDTVVVRRYLLVRAGGRKYVCPAIGRSLRKSVRADLKWNGGSQMLSPGAAVGNDASVVAASQIQRLGEVDYPDFVEQRIQHLAAEARVRQGVEERSEQEYELGQQAVRRIFWPVVASLAVLVVAFVVSLLVL